MNALRRIFQGTMFLALLAGTLAFPQAPPAEDTPSVRYPAASSDANAAAANQSEAAIPGDDAANPDMGTGEPSNDPPRRIVRLGYMNGSVSIQPEGTGDWVAADLNRPLTSADNVWADKDSRAELSVGTAVMRIDSETSLTLTNVGDASVQMQLHQGTLNLRVRHLFDGEVYEVDTPNMAFTVQKPGDYRFDVDPNQDSTVVTVRKGEGDATGQGPAVKVKSYEQVSFTGVDLAHEVHGAPQADAFDDWCKVRDDRDNNSVSARYVSPGVVGYEDLDANGTWKDAPGYGPLWVPSVPATWAPYRYGHWVWVAPWGWTWVDDAPWGFAPFHYGRWVSWGGGWGWAPGPYYWRPYYAPALVGWFGGFGWGVGFGIGFGGIGWCPLGFHEPFYPWYGHSGYYFRNVNITNTRITNINNVVRPVHYANQGVKGGFTAVPHSTLTNSQSVAKTAVPVSASAMKTAQPLSHVPVQPTHTSMLGANAGHPASAPSSRVQNRPVFSRLTPPAASHSNVAQGGAKPVQSASLTKPSTVGSTGTRGSEAINRPAASANAAAASNAAHGGNSVPRPPQGAANRGAYSSARLGGMSSTLGLQSSRTPVPRPAGNVQPFGSWGRNNSTHPATTSSEARGGGQTSGYGSHYGSPTSSPGGYGGYSHGGSAQSPAYHAPAPTYHPSAPSYHASAPLGSHPGGGSGPHGGGGGGHAAGGGGHGGGGGHR